jgi:hypothetical protein
MGVEMAARVVRRKNGCGMSGQNREFDVVYKPIENGWGMAHVPELAGKATQI